MCAVQQPHPDVSIAPQELAAALELQRERAARGGAAAAGPAGSDEEEDGEGEQGGAQPAQRPAIYNVDAIHDKLEDIGWVLGGRWLEGKAQKQQQHVPACLPGSPFCRTAPQLLRRCQQSQRLRLLLLCLNNNGLPRTPCADGRRRRRGMRRWR